MKICIIGAGSVYTPELFEKIAVVKEQFPVKKITLMDIDERRLEAVSSFCGRYTRHLGLDLELESTVDLDRAVYGADFVNAQIRVGGNQCRILDEKIPLSMGLIGQETTGAGGFMKAMRTVPAMLAIAKSIEKNAPEAWLINYTNPTGIIAQAIYDHANIKCAALCAGGIRPVWRAAEVLGVDVNDVRCDVFGLNHMNYAYNFTVRGRKITDEEFKQVAADVSEVSVELSLRIGAVLSGYLQYYYHRDKKTNELQKETKTRGEKVLELEKEIFNDFLSPVFHEKPPSLQQRGGGGYAEVAIGVMEAIYHNRDTWHVVNVPNQGVFACLPNNAVIETAVLVNASGIRPLAVGPPPKAVLGLVSMVKNYEMLTAEAAVTGDYNTALMALAHHPLVNDYDIAEKLLGRMWEANREYMKPEKGF